MFTKDQFLILLEGGAAENKAAETDSCAVFWRSCVEHSVAGHRWKESVLGRAARST